MKRETFFLKVLTPLHIGAGTSLGYVDLPIYREAHTDFPAIPSSSIKGVFRTEEVKKLAKELNLSPKELERKLEDKDKEITEKEKIKKFISCFGINNIEGNLSFIDGRILFFPVKSLKGVFGYVTCPYVLKRFVKDANLDIDDKIPDLGSSECLLDENSSLVLNDEKDEKFAVLEEFTLKVKDKLPWVINKIPLEKLGVERERVIVVSDDLFKFMVKNSTEVQTHIRVDIETGTVEGGALWTEEYVPAEAVFYFRVFRTDGSDCNYRINEKIIQLGGNSSTGKGFVEVIKYEDERTNQSR